LATSNTVRLSALSGESYVDRLACEMRELVMSVCEDRKVNLYARFRSEREDWVQAMVLAQMGFAFMPEYSVTLPGLLSRPLINPEVHREVALASMPGRPHSPAIAALVHAARGFPWPK
jgi:DNA-binding transcriptional LysR family regulator